MSDHEYAPGRKAVRGDVEGRACIVCGNLSDLCVSPIVQERDAETFQTITGSPVPAPPPRKTRRKKSA